MTAIATLTQRRLELPPVQARAVALRILPADVATLHEILRGLDAPQKRLPTRLLYDAAGSRLFEAICELPEYQVTRSELDLLRLHAQQIADFVGIGSVVIEPGAGVGVKSGVLLHALSSPRRFVPVEIDDAALARCTAAVRAVAPSLQVQPVHADFTRPFTVERQPREGRRLLFLPGSTIGNFEPDVARGLLRQFRHTVGEDGLMLIGIDLRRNAARLRNAYDDADGVTARFNLNLLSHVNRDYGGAFDLESFAHRAVYDKQRHRIEMHLVSLWPQIVQVAGCRFSFAGGESIHTENSYKYLPRQFAALAAASGWEWQRLWMAPQRNFALLAFSAGS